MSTNWFSKIKENYEDTCNNYIEDLKTRYIYATIMQSDNYLEARNNLSKELNLPTDYVDYVFSRAHTSVLKSINRAMSTGNLEINKKTLRK